MCVWRERFTVAGSKEGGQERKSISMCWHGACCCWVQYIVNMDW